MDTSNEQLSNVQKIALSYYSRKDIQNAIYEFCKNRETVPNYNKEFYGKRPDALDFPSDIMNYAKKGATSFHCSEELWSDALKIPKDSTPQQLNDLRIGWDLLIDVDSKYFDYSKLAAQLMIKALEYHGIKNIGIKYSGSKGFHILVPWKAFPKEVDGIQTKNMFPEWARLIANYLDEITKEKLSAEIFKISNAEELEKKGKTRFEVFCKNCEGKAEIKKLSKYKCLSCKAEVSSTRSTRKKLTCPSCTGIMQRLSKAESYLCNHCKLSSQKFPEKFEKRPTTDSLIDSVDIILVSSRHLFRVPYSLHEKTALASVVLTKEELASFQPTMADPLKIKIKNFMPDSEENEARGLLLQAIDWQKQKNPEKKKVFTGKSIDVKNLTITEGMFPDCIKQILNGQKQDGRKRALFVLLGFFNTLGFPQEYILEKIEKSF